MSAALEALARVLLAILYLLCALLTAVAVGLACLLTRERPTPLPIYRPETKHQLDEFEVDACDEALGSHPHCRGIAPAAAEGLGPRVLRRAPSPIVPRSELPAAAQKAVDEILGKRGHRR